MPLDIHAYFLPVEDAIQAGAKTRDFAKAYKKLEQALANIQEVLMLVYANEFAPLEVANRDLVEMHRQDTLIIKGLREDLANVTEYANPANAITNRRQRTDSAGGRYFQDTDASS